MNIDGINFPSIGHIRARPLPSGEDWQLEIYPPTPGPIMGHEPAHMVEVTVCDEELQRIERVVPHLCPGVYDRNRDRLRNAAWHGQLPVEAAREASGA